MNENMPKIDIGDTECFLTKLGVAVKDAEGNYRPIRFLTKLGVAVKDAEGNYRPITDIMNDLADAWEKIGKINKV